MVSYVQCLLRLLQHKAAQISQTFKLKTVEGMLVRGLMLNVTRRTSKFTISSELKIILRKIGKTLKVGKNKEIESWVS